MNEWIVTHTKFKAPSWVSHLVTMTKNQGCSFLCLFTSTVPSNVLAKVTYYLLAPSIAYQTQQTNSLFLLSFKHYPQYSPQFFFIVHIVSLCLFCCTFQTQFISWFSVLWSYSHDNISIDYQKSSPTKCLNDGKLPSPSMEGSKENAEIQNLLEYYSISILCPQK